LIELSSAVKNLKPISLASKIDLVNQTKITLIARNKKVSSVLTFARSYGTVTVLFISSASGACLGDSGGAVLINKNDEPKLAGILMYSGDETYVRKTS
jgi:hypothetical protein